MTSKPTERGAEEEESPLAKGQKRFYPLPKDSHLVREKLPGKGEVSRQFSGKQVSRE